MEVLGDDRRLRRLEHSHQHLDGATQEHVSRTGWHQQSLVDGQRAVVPSRPGLLRDGNPYYCARAPAGLPVQTTFLPGAPGRRAFRSACRSLASVRVSFCRKRQGKVSLAPDRAFEVLFTQVAVFAPVSGAKSTRLTSVSTAA